MLAWFEKLSFSARLVLTMNISMAVVMLSVGLSYSYKLIQDLETQLDTDKKYELRTIALSASEIEVANFKNFLAELEKELVKEEGFVALEWQGENSGSFKVENAEKFVSVNSVEQINAKGQKFILTYTYDALWNKKRSAIFELLIFLGIGMLFFTIVMYLLGNYFIKPLKEVSSALSSATGKTDMNSAKLKEMSSSVQSSGNIISTGSTNTTSSMKDLSLTIEKSVSELRQCLEIASRVNSKADSGTDIMKRLVNSMQVIEEANNKLTGLGKIFEEISSKTSVINDIVFKTQLLSFNASIEAARAGQHGRGFSVVAEEIGNLAQMSGKSATEISALLANSEGQVKSIISGTDEKIEEGRNVSNEAMLSFDEIRKEITEITNTIASVSERSRVQEEAIKSTLDTMLSLEETVLEQGIYTRSIGKSAQEIAQESKILRRADELVSRLIFGHKEEVSHKVSHVKEHTKKLSQMAAKLKNNKAA